MKHFFLLILVCCNTIMLQAQRTMQPIDANSKIGFNIKNFGMNTDGRLTGLKGSIVFDPANIGASFVDVTVNTTTIDTDNDKRDKHLRGTDYFNVAQFPTIRINGKPSLTKTGTYVLSANLTIRGVSKQMLIPFKATPQNGGWLFTGNFDINRLNFKVGKESMVLSDIVKVSLSIFAK